MDIYMDYTKDQAQKLSDLFEVGLDMNNFIISLDNTRNKVIKNDSPDNFVIWINEINELKENGEENITHYDDDYNTSLRISYVKFNESMLNVIVLENIVQNILKTEKLFGMNMFKCKDIYFEFIFYDKHIDNLHKDNAINDPWNESLFEAKDYYNTDVDNIGNKFYYLKKNFRLNLLHQQKSLIQKAKDEFQEYLYEGTTISKKELLKKYNKKYDKNELNKLIKLNLNILKRNRVDIYFHYYKDI